MYEEMHALSHEYRVEIAGLVRKLHASDQNRIPKKLILFLCSCVDEYDEIDQCVENDEYDE
jgi:hypothetical protein